MDAAKGQKRESLQAKKKKSDPLVNYRAIQTPPNSLNSSFQGKKVSTVPTLRQKTAILSRRNTFSGKVPVDSRYLTAKCFRPRRSVSDDSTVSSSSSSSDAMTPYKQALYNLENEERWKKDISLGTRVGLYRLYRDVGKGNFSKVKLAVHWITKERVAVKVIDKGKLQLKTRKMLSKEISVMQSVCHPHIIRLFEVLETPSKVFLAMEYASGGELFYKISTEGRFSDEQAKHQQNIIHRDVKAENVFLAGPNLVKVGDFGFSTCVKSPDQALATFCGSYPYAAPELFVSDKYVGPSVDLWSLGVLLFLMVTASLPFKGETIAAVKKQVLSGHFTTPQYVSEKCRSLITGLLQQDPSRRLTINQVKASDWLKGIAIVDPLQERKRHLAAEKEAKKAILDLGIPEDDLKEEEGKGARGAAIGTYRIVLHKLERGDSYLKCGSKQNRKGILTCPTFESKACAIV